MSSSTSVVDTGGPTDSAPRGPPSTSSSNSVVDTTGATGSASRGPPPTSPSNSVVDAAEHAHNASRGAVIDIVFKLGGGHYRTYQQRLLGRPPTTSFSNLVVDAVRPASSATQGGHHRCCLQTQSWTLPESTTTPPGGPAIDVIFKLGGGCCRCRTHQHRPPMGLISTSSSNSVQDAARPASSATQGAAIDVVFKPWCRAIGRSSPLDSCRWSQRWAKAHNCRTTFGLLHHLL
jgi:hypothetical protein